MKFLFTTQPGLGHLHTMVPYAMALRNAGHTVAYACSASFVPFVTAAGLTAFPAGLDWLESQAAAAFPELVDIPLEQRPRTWLLTEVFADIAAHAMIPDLQAICAEWQPDLLVRNDVEFASTIVGELLHIPYATIGTDTFLPAERWREQIDDQLAYLRSAYGLDPYTPQLNLHGEAYLSSMPPSYEFPESRGAPGLHHFCMPLFEQKTNGLTNWREGLPNQPTVYATLGTVFNRAETTIAALLDGLSNAPFNVLFTIGSGQDPQAFGTPAPNIRIERYLPLAHILPFCDAAIVHGGYATTLAAISYGLPMLMIPGAASGVFRAMHCVASGSGLALNPGGIEVLLPQQGRGRPAANDPIDPRNWPNVTPTQVRLAIETIVATPRFREHAAQVRQEHAEQAGPAQAVVVFEHLANYAKGASL